MPTITQSDNSANYVKLNSLISDAFLPFVKLDNTDDLLSNSYSKNGHKLESLNDEFNLSMLLDEPKHKPYILKTLNEEVSLLFKISKGNNQSIDDKGKIKVTIPEIEGIKIISETEFDATYNSNYELKLSININYVKEFCVDFYAKDEDEDDWLIINNDGSLEYKIPSMKLDNVHCGRIHIKYENTTKVGKRLTSNIEGLPQAPKNYKKPPTYLKPKKSFLVANKYQNCYGMCFAVSMARINKAYEDEFSISTLDFNLKGNDYIYSGTIVNTIPNKYFGYGVGGVLALKNYAVLVNEKQIWDGDLKEGASLQYWNETNLETALNRIKSRDPYDPQYGHSVIFKSYIKNGDSITGLIYYDYSGKHKYKKKDGNKIFLGANLKDIL